MQDYGAVSFACVDKKTPITYNNVTSTDSSGYKCMNKINDTYANYCVKPYDILCNEPSIKYLTYYTASSYDSKD